MKFKVKLRDLYFKSISCITFNLKAVLLTQEFSLVS